MGQMWCSPPQEVPRAFGPAAKVKECSLGLCNPSLCSDYLGLPGGRKLGYVYMAGHMMAKSNTDSFFKKAFWSHLLILYLTGHHVL